MHSRPLVRSGCLNNYSNRKYRKRPRLAQYRTSRLLLRLDGDNSRLNYSIKANVIENYIAHILIIDFERSPDRSNRFKEANNSLLRLCHCHKARKNFRRSVFYAKLLTRFRLPLITSVNMHTTRFPLSGVIEL
ncbi:hypothetical protein TcasGA2_TC005699 [Tribolium castaneum]|uniref:Uncharacterized protein n=1 Tax=Tribolium castaneum TaxID=7070 RepID=D6WWQ8_TRICA|nr:hypothetical protein TcasGA2_TC005699 [Tribolium castaneum]